MEKVKVSLSVKSVRSTETARFESGNPAAKVPATPLQTLIAAASHIARIAEIHQGAGDVLLLAVGDAIQQIKERAK